MSERQEAKGPRGRRLKVQPARDCSSHRSCVWPTLPRARPPPFHRDTPDTGRSVRSTGNIAIAASAESACTRPCRAEECLPANHPALSARLRVLDKQRSAGAKRRRLQRAAGCNTQQAASAGVCKRSRQHIFEDKHSATGSAEQGAHKPFAAQTIFTFLPAVSRAQERPPPPTLLAATRTSSSLAPVKPNASAA
jgi:hypothetical protein